MTKAKKIKLEDIKTMKDVEAWLNQNDQYEKERNSKDGGHHVSVIFADCEYCSTKGGDLLFKRTLHQFGPPLIFNKRKLMKLNNGKGEEAFVIIYGGDRIYNKMKKIWESENVKPEKMSNYDKNTVDEFIRVCIDYYEALKEKAYELRQECYAARDERKKFKKEWLENNPTTCKYDETMGKEMVEEDGKLLRRCYKEARRRESDERYIQMYMDIPMPLRHLDESMIEMYSLVEYLANRALAMTERYVKTEPVTIYSILQYWAPLDSDTKLYVDRFLDDQELKKRYKSLAVRMNRLSGKYDHLMRDND